MSKINTSLFLSASVFIAFFGTAEPVSADFCQTIDSNTRYWLEKLSCSSQQIRHAGIIAVQRSSKLDVYRMVNNEENIASNNLAILSARGEKTISYQSEEVCISSTEREFPRVVNGCHLAEHYNISIVGSKIVSDRAVVVLALNPKDDYRYRYRLDMDKKTGLLIGMRTLNSAHDIIERFHYAEIDFRAVPSDPLQPNIQSDDKVNIVENHRNLDFAQWEISWLPSGFKPVRDSLTDKKRESFTDGLASFTVFLEPVVQKKTLPKTEGAITWGGMTSYINTIKLATNWVLITVVGDIPVKAAKRIAQSVKVASN